MTTKIRKEKKSKERYIIGLPDVDLGVPQYQEVPKIGTTYATTPASAVSSYLFRYLSPAIARVVTGKIKEDYGYDDHTFRILEDNVEAEEIAVATFLFERLGKSPPEYLERARNMLSDFKKQSTSLRIRYTTNRRRPR